MTVEKRILVSSYGISGIEANDIYMAVKVKMLSDRRNLNDMRVTAAFIDAIVADRQRYIGTPLVVDKLRLESGQYSRLTHLQDERTGSFGSQQIGSFVAFETMHEADGETVLVGTARVEKRFERACAAIQQLYEMDKLRVSFEIIASVYTQTTDEIVIDANDGNKLIGMCIVSIPAYEDARALALVASMTTEPDSLYPPYMLPAPWTPGSVPIQIELVQSAVPSAAPAQEANVEVPQLPSAEEDTPQTTLEEITPPAAEAPLQEAISNERNDVMTETEQNLAAQKNEEEKHEETAPDEEKKPEAQKAEAAAQALAALKAENEALKASNAELAQIKAKWDAAEAAALKVEEEKKREGLRKLLASHQLKAEDHQTAIDQLDYAAIIAACNAAPVHTTEVQTQAVTAAVNGLVQQGGMQMAGNKSDHPYHKLVKNLTL